MEALLGKAAGGRKRKWSPPSGSLFHFPGRHSLLEEPTELGLRQRVKASVAHISRLLRGRPEGYYPYPAPELGTSTFPALHFGAPWPKG